MHSTLMKHVWCYKTSITIGDKPWGLVCLTMSAHKVSAILKACQDVGIQIPTPVKPQSQKKFPDAPWQKVKKIRSDMINPTEFSIVPDFFLNSDDTSTGQIQQVRAQATGLCLMTPGEAAPWIREGTTLSSDELAIVVLGKMPETPMPQTKVTFPCKNADGALVLLQGTIVQLGNKHVKWRADDKPVQPDHCQLIAITLYKQDFNDTQWQEALQSTPSFIRKILQVDQLNTAISAIWGRSLRAGRTPASPVQATTIQMHCTVEKTQVKPLLRSSGFNYLFCTPKDETGKLATEFRIIWMGSDHIRVTAASAKVTGCLGLVRGRNNALGLRFDQATYSAAWKQLCPDVEMPSRSDNDQNYKIQGLPFGCSQKMLTEWGQHQAWPCKPTRALGPQAWIVRCEMPPKSDHIYMFNGNPVLITHLLPKENDSRQALLGPRSKSGQQDPWTRGHDPWATYNQTPHTAPAPQRSIDGPLESKFKAHDEQIAKLQTDLAKVVQTQENQAQHTQQQFEQAAHREQQQAKEVHDTLQRMQNSWDKSLSQAMQHHTKAMDHQFAEIKALFQQKRKSPEDADDHMGGSWLGTQQPKSTGKQRALSIAFCWAFLCQFCHRVFSVLTLLRSQFKSDVQPRTSGNLRRWLLWWTIVFHCCSVQVRAVREHSTDCIQFCLPDSVSVFATVHPVPRPAYLPEHLAGHPGEATNPGPPETFRLAITNPTSIYSKEQQYRELRDIHNVHMATASETAATEKAQNIFHRKMTRTYRNIQWSPPVAEKRARTDGEPSLRGQPAGVATLSTFPARTALDTSPTKWQQTSRILHTVIAIGHLQIQVVVIYAYTPGGHPNAHAFNSEMIHAALDAITYMPLPAMILGDFNGNPFQWGVGDRLRSLGYHDLPFLHSRMYNKDMPFTCKDATRPDNGLFCPRTSAMIASIQVHREFMFDAHSPVLVELKIPQTQTVDQRLPLPKSFLDLPIDFSHMDVAYHEALQINGAPTTIEQWGKQVEHAVDIAYRKSQDISEHSQTHGLPKAYRGRCQPKPLKRLPTKALLKPARPGDYSPLYELHSWQAQKMVRQVRRLQSLMRGLSRAQPNYPVLLADWKACLADTSFHGSFVWWCQNIPEIGPPPVDLPTVDLVHTIYQMAKFETDSKIHFDHTTWQNKTAYRRHLDSKAGNRTAFSILRQYTPPLTTLQQTTQQQAILIQQPDSTELYLDDPTQFDQTQPLYVGEERTQIKAIHQCHLQTPTLQQADTQNITITQHRCHYQPDDVAKQLNDFWRQYWQVENPDDIDPAALQQAITAWPANALQGIDTYQLDLWLDCVRRLNPRSARGVDAISAAEIRVLPVRAIQDLMDVMHNYPEGYPQWFMLAKTHPIPKTQSQPGPSQIRPITVLAQLFRVWSQVLTRSVVRRMSQIMADDITGFLPGKAATDVRYEQQRAVEEAHRWNEPTSGCCLDLHKCFNTVRRKVALAALERLGVPSNYLTQWKNSMEHLHRVWCLQDYVSTPETVNNGLAEGDPFSVACMLSLGHLWVANVKAETPLCKLSAYADNWAWRTTNPQQHHSIAAVTIRITALAGMSIDWAKSWLWTTHKQHLPAMQRALRPLIPEATLKDLLHSMDLGCVMHYRGTHRLGTWIKRIHEGLRRAQALKTMPHDLKTKTLVTKAAIYAQAFFGAEIMPLGAQHTDKLRTALADALLGKSPSRNSTIALACVPNLMDPEPFLVLQAIRSAKRFLLRSTQQQQQAFFSTAAQHPGTWTQCHGPAGSLKYYFRRLGWTISSEGQVNVSGFVSLSLLRHGLPTFRKWIQFAWQETILTQHCDRREVKGLQPISIPDTQQTLKTLTPKEQSAIVNEIAGAYQTKQQQAAWDQEITGLCPHCQAPDTKEHRLYQCPVLDSIRAKYAAALTWFRFEGTTVHELPVVHQHEDTEWLKTFFHQLQIPPVQAHLTHHLRQQSQIQPLTFYTDGSCQRPEQPTTRNAAFAIIYDATTSVAQRQAEALLAQTTGQPPASLHLLLASMLPGKQGIHRAELQAITWICTHFDNTIIYTDSQVALSLAIKCQQQIPLTALAHHDDFDLLCELHEAMRHTTHDIRKIKAHETLNGFSGEELYHHIGNSHAHDAALSAATKLYPALQHQLTQHHTSITTYQRHLAQLFQMHLEAHKVRAIADSSLPTNTQPHEPRRQLPRQQLIDYTISHPFQPQPVRINKIDACAFGPALSGKVILWMEKLKWPQADNQHPQQSLGITWIELMLSCMLDIRCYIPVRRADQAGTDRVFLPASQAEIDQFDVKLSEMSQMFSMLIYQIEELIAPSPWPKVTKGIAKSLYVQGAAGNSQGYLQRPCTPHQAQVIQLLQPYLRETPGPGFHKFLKMPFEPCRDTCNQIKPQLEGQWQEKCHRARMTFRKVKDWKKRNSGQAQLVFR